MIDDLARLEGVTAVGVDERRFLNASPDHRTVSMTRIVDLDRHLLLDAIKGRSRDVLDDWLTERGDQWCAQIALAIPDPVAGYSLALVENLPNATMFVDHFHAIKLANTAIDEVRRRVKNDTLGHRVRQGGPLWRGRRVFLTAMDRISDERIAWMLDLLAAGDPYGEVAAAIVVKGLLREVYSAIDEAQARRRLIVFFQHCADAHVPELRRPARTIDGWRELILAYQRTGGASNGRVDNTHMLAEKIRRNAHGFTNHTNHCRRLLG